MNFDWSVSFGDVLVACALLALVWMAGIGAAIASAATEPRYSPAAKFLWVAAFLLLTVFAVPVYLCFVAPRRASRLLGLLIVRASLLVPAIAVHWFAHLPGGQPAYPPGTRQI